MQGHAGSIVDAFIVYGNLHVWELTCMGTHMYALTCIYRVYGPFIQYSHTNSRGWVSASAERIGAGPGSGLLAAAEDVCMCFRHRKI